MVADNSFYYNTFVDCRLGDQDVRFAKIPLAGPGAVLSVSSFNPNSLAVARNSCNDLFVTLTNDGTATASGVTLTLMTATPGVTLPVNMQSYGNIAAAASATNASAFTLSIDNTFVCGAPIVINWTTNTGDSGSFTITTQGLGYTQSTMTGQTIVPGTTRIDGTGADDATFPVTIPFTFTFFGTNFTAGNVSSNGNLQFTSNNSGFTNFCPFPIAAMNNLISPYWDDLETDVGAGSGIFTSTSGVTPSRIFNIDFHTVTFSSPQTPMNFEIRLYETTGQIDFVYGALLSGGVAHDNGASASVGIQKGTGAVPATDVSQFSCNTASLSTGLKITFTPVTSCPTGAGACGGANCTSITCPANISANVTPNTCGAVVTYPAPTTSGTCTVTCSPASGSTFPKGTTTVACSNTGGTPSCTFTITVTDNQPPVITCPANKTQNTDPNLCSAVVTYNNATATDNCPGVGTPVCAPASGSTFPKGVTTVTCSVADASGNPANCSFTVTVVDMQPPTITCPPNQTAVTDQNVCPSPACQVVNYPAPVASDNCPGVGVVCNPPAGSCFPTGVTTVTCTATDGSGNTATCSFTLTTFDAALQDDSNPANILLWNSITGQYRFCCLGVTFTGVGKSTIKGCVYTLETPNAADRRIVGRVEKAVHAGTGSLQAPPGTTRCTITDRNTLNDTNLTSCQ